MNFVDFLFDFVNGVMLEKLIEGEGKFVVEGKWKVLKQNDDLKVLCLKFIEVYKQNLVDKVVEEVVIISVFIIGVIDRGV